MVVCDDASATDRARSRERYRGATRASRPPQRAAARAVENWRAPSSGRAELHPEAPYFGWAAITTPGIRAGPSVWSARSSDPGGGAGVRAHVPVRRGPARRCARWTPLRKPGASDRGARLPAARAGCRPATWSTGSAGRTRSSAAGSFDPVLVPDRSARGAGRPGRVRAVAEILWYRRMSGVSDAASQRRSFFPDGAPAHARLPWWLQHAGAMAWALGVHGSGRPAVSRPSGIGLAAVHAAVSAAFAGTQAAHRLAGRRGRRPRR